MPRAPDPAALGQASPARHIVTDDRVDERKAMPLDLRTTLYSGFDPMLAKKPFGTKSPRQAGTIAEFNNSLISAQNWNAQATPRWRGARSDDQSAKGKS
jgi:hypothetical protein